MRHSGRLFAALLALTMAWGTIVTARAGGTVGPHTTQVGGNQPWRLQPGGTATITFESFCIDYGKKFPDSIGLPPTSVAESAIVGALNYAVGKGYTSSQPKEVQFAIWQARGANGAPAPGAIGQEISANSGAQPTAPAGATSVIDALKSGQITATAGSWEGIGEKLTINNFDDSFQGRGEIKLENTSDQEVTLYMPVGTLFPAPAAEFQSMAGYATQIEVTNPLTQQMPDTGAVGLTGSTAMILLLLGLDVLALGYVLQRRARA